MFTISVFQLIIWIASLALAMTLDTYVIASASEAIQKKFTERFYNRCREEYLGNLNDT